MWTSGVNLDRPHYLCAIDAIDCFIAARVAFSQRVQKRLQIVGGICARNKTPSIDQSSFASAESVFMLPLILRCGGQPVKLQGYSRSDEAERLRWFTTGCLLTCLMPFLLFFWFLSVYLVFCFFLECWDLFHPNGRLFWAKASMIEMVLVHLR